jgi:hypothetical protein
MKLFSHGKLLLGQKQVIRYIRGGLCAIYSFLGIIESCTWSRVAKLLDNGSLRGQASESSLCCLLFLLLVVVAKHSLGRNKPC